MNRRWITRIATLSAALAAGAGPVTLAHADPGAQPRETQNLVTPDARDAAAATGTSATTEASDARTPDAQDAADGRGTWNTPAVTVVKVPQVETVQSSTGLDWGDAGIGAGAVLGLMLVAGAGGLAIVHRRNGAPRPKRPATTA
jgi:hypothetical protein